MERRWRRDGEEVERRWRGVERRWRGDRDEVKTRRGGGE